ncbi:MAG: helix-turn-helix transcriptional regulator [Dokdonella sp.]
MRKRPVPTPADRDQLRQVVAGLSEGVILIERNRRLAWANAAACAMHGVNDVSELGRTLADYRKRFQLHYRNHHPVPAGSYPLERAFAGERFNDVVVEVVPVARPELKWVHRTRSLAVNDVKGAPDFHALFLIDVTDWASAEQRFERAFNANPAPAMICRLADLRFIKVNRGFLDMTGYVSEQVVGRSVYEIDVLEQSDSRSVSIERLVAGETIPQTEAELRIADGTSKLIIVAGQPIEISNEACMLFTFMDLEPRRRAESALRHSEERFEKAFQMTPVPTLVFDADRWEIIEANEAFVSSAGYAREELVGRTVDDIGLLSADTARTQIASALKRNGIFRDIECLVMRKDGNTIDCLVSAETVLINGVACVLLALLDITHRRRSELELVAAVEAVMKDASWLSGPLIEKLANVRRGIVHERGPELADLTNRERDVLALIGEGLTDKAIAARLRVSPSTVRNHAAAVYSKLDLHTRGEAIVWARERGFAGKTAVAPKRKARAQR